ncbi:MAG: hypothetical protein UY23_C0001G0031 [Candidatus Jorgensenbacteria bacterium GW2011_GWA1_48_11]|uniref:Uncharacterized protein n=1 Tax=Candidatus Jorgensenbacteria bacterium GW2011_GWA1_48_11 TaxID=1618660 RepID=A0A0G1XAS2_9BACT|nr:MAG: hypothetical protein UY23_C0001G0031 [Candidatus Jorgensenbacteria bacterium GW2011_GWA1_48_11]KKW11920.1 MAG: hypothetical protein UY51_C0005G0162 [Candidatus Jorgensenbacteria bacterium GW2011_GWB1_49_9]
MTRAARVLRVRIDAFLEGELDRARGVVPEPGQHFRRGALVLHDRGPDQVARVGGEEQLEIGRAVFAGRDLAPHEPVLGFGEGPQFLGGALSRGLDFSEDPGDLCLACRRF